MLNRSLLRRSILGSAPLLLSCCALVGAFIWLRVWVASQIDFGSVIDMFHSGEIPDFAMKLLPVPIESLAAPLGRVAFGFEELPVALLAALWAVARGSDCIAGRVGNGTMEMLLAQPLSRLSLLSSHSAITLLGAALIGFCAWLGTGLGLATSHFDQPPAWSDFWPPAINVAAIGVFLIGVSTLISALASSRGQAVAVMVGFYFLQIAFKIISLLSPNYLWLKKWTFLTAYEPTLLTVGLQANPDKYWPIFWQHNLLLSGIGIAALAVAAVIFCHRDVPAPL